MDICILLRRHLALGEKWKPVVTSDSTCWLGEDLWTTLPRIKTLLALSTSYLVQMPLWASVLTVKTGVKSNFWLVAVVKIKL